MRSIYDRALKELHYPATYFLKMLQECGGRETAKRLLAKPEVSDGFVFLWNAERLDLTMENQLLENPKYWELFTEPELTTARRWLKHYQDNPPRK